MKMTRRKDLDDCQRYALKLLKIRLRSKHELEERLRTHGCEEEDVKKTIKELRLAAFIDDERFAILFAEDQLEFHIKGPRYVRYKLRNFGVDETIIDRALEGVFLSEKIKESVERYVKSHESHGYEKVFNALLRRGFEASVVHEILAEIYKDWRCNEDESGNDDDFDIRTDSRVSGDIGISSGENERTERTKKGQRKRGRDTQEG